MYSPRSSTEGPLDAVMGTGGLFDTNGKIHEHPPVAVICRLFSGACFNNAYCSSVSTSFSSERTSVYTTIHHDLYHDISWQDMIWYDVIWYDMICHIYIYLNYIIFLLLYTVCTHPGLPWPIPYLRPLGPGQRSHPHSGAQHEPKAPLRCDEEKHTLW